MTIIIIKLYKVGEPDDHAEELSYNVFFTEFQDLPSSITNLEMRIEGTRRLIVFGCQSGFLKCCLVDISDGSKSIPLSHQQKLHG